VREFAVVQTWTHWEALEGPPDHRHGGQRAGLWQWMLAWNVTLQVELTNWLMAAWT